MGNWKKSILYIKYIYNTKINNIIAYEVQGKPFKEEKEENKIYNDGLDNVESEYEVTIGDDISRHEAEIISSFETDIEDYDENRYTKIDLSNYEICKEKASGYHYFEDENYDENCIYLDGEEPTVENIHLKLKDVISQIDIENFSNKELIIITY